MSDSGRTPSDGSIFLDYSYWKDWYYKMVGELKEEREENEKLRRQIGDLSRGKATMKTD